MATETIRLYLSRSMTPLVWEYVMAIPGHLRTKRFSSIFPFGCETVLRTEKLGGALASGGALNPDLFADPSDAELPDKYQAVFKIDSAVTPNVYQAVKGQPEDVKRGILISAFQTFLLTIEATTLPVDKLGPEHPRTRRVGHPDSPSLSSGEQDSTAWLATNSQPEDSQVATASPSPALEPENDSGGVQEIQLEKQVEKEEAPSAKDGRSRAKSSKASGKSEKPSRSKRGSAADAEAGHKDEDDILNRIGPAGML